MRQVFRPRNLAELWDIWSKEPDARLLAGGTDLLVHVRAGAVDAPAFICLEKVNAIKGVREDSGYLWIGAGSTHAELLKDSLIRGHLPILSQALGQLGSPLIRNAGTIGGNVCTASPAGDALPPLYLLDAVLEIHASTGRRDVSIRDFITGPGTTTLGRGEVLVGIRVRPPSAEFCHHFEKVGQRRSLSCAVASFAALVKASKDGVIEEARLAWGSVAPSVLTAPHIEAFLRRQRISTHILKEAARMVRQDVSPIDDVRATAAYRREVAGNLLLRLARD